MFLKYRFKENKSVFKQLYYNVAARHRLRCYQPLSSISFLFLVYLEAMDTSPRPVRASVSPFVNMGKWFLTPTYSPCYKD